MERRAGMVRVALVTALVGLAAAGCASTPVERQQATVQSLVELRSAMAGTQQQIEQSLAALITLMNAPAPRTDDAFARYASAVDTMASRTARIHAESGRLQDRRSAWLSGWTESYGEVQDRQLRRLTEERREQVLARFETIEGSLQAAHAALTPFVENLQDIKSVAGNDLSPLGLRALSRTQVVRNANENAREAAQALQVSVNDLQALIQSLAPARAARAPG